MLMFFFSMNWLFSLIFLMLNHPLSLGSILLLQTMIISISSGYLYYNFWFSYILFLIMISGMLVLLIYMTSTASNEKFKIPKKKIMMMLSFLFMMIMISLMMLDSYFNLYMSMLINNQNQSMFNLTSYFCLNKFYNMPSLKLMISLMIYLFVTLIASVKIVGKTLGTLRQK